MARLFISHLPQGRSRWREAFPDSDVIDSAAMNSVDASAFLSVWIDLSNVQSAANETVLDCALRLGRPIVAMSAVPAEAQAFALIRRGVHGYCHCEAAPEQLAEIAVVVEHGGLWMPPQLMRRFLNLSMRVQAGLGASWYQVETLTDRERMVAERVGQGASNREIAADLNVSERTVKSHLTTIFDKLGVRDRVQLALAMNDIELPARSAAH